MQTVIKEYVDSVDTDLLQAAQELRKNKNAPFVRKKICGVDADFAADAKDVFDLDIDEYTVQINSNAFNHIEKRHGENGQADKSMANLNDVARIGYVIENRDSLEPLLVNGEQVYSKEFQTKDDAPAPLMLIKKKINGTYYCAIAVTDGKYKKVWVQTAFINKRDGLTQVLHDEISSLSLTSETVPVSHPSNNSIPETTEKINSSDERKSKTRSYDPKNGKDITFEEVPGGIKVNFNDFDTTESNYKSNDSKAAEQARQDSMDALLESEAKKAKQDSLNASRKNYARADASAKARQDSLDALLNFEPPKKDSVYVDNSLLRRVTNNTKAKKFTRKDVKNIVDELLRQDGYFGDNFVHLKGKQRAEAERMLWQELNTKREGELGSTALDIADYIIRNTIATEYLEVTEDVQLAVQFIDAIKPYLHNMNLEAIKGDIKAKFDDNNAPYLMWAVRKNSDFRGYTADEVKQELEALGLGFAFEKTSEADIFFEIDNLYKLAKQTIIDATPSKQTLLTAIGTNEAKKLKQKLAKDIVDAQYTKGTETSFYKLQQKYIDKIAKLGNEVKQAHKRNTLNNRILKEAKKISDSNKHTFANSTEAQTDALKNIKSLLSRSNSREQVNRTSMREIMKELSLWYNQENPVLGYTDEQHPGFYSKQIAELTRYFGEVDSTEQTTKKEKPLSIDELEFVNVILHHMNHIFENYGKIWRGGKYVEAADVVKTHYEVLEDAEKNVPSFERMFLQNKYVRFFMDPMLVLATWDGHDPNGYFTTTYKDFVEGLINQRYDEMQALAELDCINIILQHYLVCLVTVY